MNDTNDTQENPSTEPIVFAPTTEPAVRVFIMAAMLLGLGGWCWFDKANYSKPQAWTSEYINEIANYVFNHWGPFLFIPVGAVFLAMGIRHLTRKMTADSEGLGYSCEDKVLWTNVTALDASVLKEKGKLTLTYDQSRQLVLDSYKLHNFRDLVALIEQHLPELAGEAHTNGDQE